MLLREVVVVVGSNLCAGGLLALPGILDFSLGRGKRGQWAGGASPPHSLRTATEAESSSALSQGLVGPPPAPTPVTSQQALLPHLVPARCCPGLQTSVSSARSPATWPGLWASS